MSVPKWDERYRDVATINKQPAATLIRALAVWNNPPGDALDLACGAGRHSLYLANAGWHVTAVDASETALDLIRLESHPNIRAVNAGRTAARRPRDDGRWRRTGRSRRTASWPTWNGDRGMRADDGSA